MQTCAWKRFGWRLSQLGYLTFSGIALSTQVSLAQIVPDATLGNESSVVTPSAIKDLPSDRINGGAVRGNNLFHSFREFNVGAGRGVYFANPDGVTRILTRVTGNNVSQILGTLGVLGNADLFLINPNGIIFGQGARLDLNGSFIGSTASKISFGDGLEFSATNPQASPLLSVNVPIGLQFGTNPGRIVNQSTDEGNNIAPLRPYYPVPRLRVAPGRTFALIGGDVLIEGGTMGAFEGRIELGSVGDNGFVGLSPIAQGWALNYDRVQNFGDINLSQNAVVDTSGQRGGDIQVRARNLTLQEGAIIYYVHEGSEVGGNLDVTTTDSVELIGGLNPFFSVPTLDTYTQISATTRGTATGTAGNVTVKTRRLTIRDGASLSNISNGNGNAGNLTVLASELVEVTGIAADESIPSNIVNQTYKIDGDGIPIGNAGNITIETERLLIEDGAFVSSGTYTAGQAGNLTIKAAESVEIIGATRETDFLTGIAATVEFDQFTNIRATGNGGNLTIQTRRLSVQNGGQIASSTSADGNAGNLVIDASESVELVGVDPNADAVLGSSGLFVSAERGRNGNPGDATGNVGNLTVNTRRLLIQDGGRISADNFGSGTGGDLTINAREVNLQSGGTVRANSFSTGSGGMLTVNAENVNISGSRILGDQLINSGLFVSGAGSGAAGSLEVNAAKVQLDNTGRLAADSTAGSGNIRVQARDLLLLRGNSLISTNSTGEEPGGNISLTTNNLVALGNSDITANATNSQGGRVSINATGIFGPQYRLEQTPNSDITATGGNPELNGVVEINSPEVDVNSGLVYLPTNLIDVSGLVAQNACTSQQAEGSSFVVTGRGGLPPNPVNPATNEAVMVEWARVADMNQNVNSQRRTNSRSNSHVRAARNYEQIVEAQGWVVGADGRVVLTAEGGRTTPQSFSLIHPSCDILPVQN
ncbi:S-layer family protein [Phormidium sp. LEGE 05292]|uniref:beta strand repeat-containing protein n=1 Tax=[Phormidium] sp. LEGE 05292 TaxID=767427 RepID=UPI0018809818|nr:S-layer family protein [Phormidium sp. LEGE 05292]MBE9224929.1 S-layer family protein [Phormidium sp. LEGE 05292]